MLYFDDGKPFATGSIPYTYRPIREEEASPRIIVNVLIGDLQISAYVDTGGVFLLCAPEVALHLGLEARNGIPTPRLLSRGAWLSGVLYRVSLTLPADQGIALTIDATAFVPEQAPHQEWADDFPCILGMSGCLERLRFAIDPVRDTFYFGELSGN